jgi:hypothetical protein
VSYLSALLGGKLGREVLYVDEGARLGRDRSLPYMTDGGAPGLEQEHDDRAIDWCEFYSCDGNGSNVGRAHVDRATVTRTAFVEIDFFQASKGRKSRDCPQDAGAIFLAVSCGQGTWAYESGRLAFGRS